MFPDSRADSAVWIDNHCLHISVSHDEYHGYNQSWLVYTHSMLLVVMVQSHAKHPHLFGWLEQMSDMWTPVGVYWGSYYDTLHNRDDEQRLLLLKVWNLANWMGCWRQDYRFVMNVVDGGYQSFTNGNYITYRFETVSKKVCLFSICKLDIITTRTPHSYTPRSDLPFSLLKHVNVSQYVNTTAAIYVLIRQTQYHCSSTG